MRRHGWNGDLPADDAEARERILEAAVRSAQRDGLGIVNVSRIAEEVGITRQTLYRYFPDANDLLRNVEVRVGGGLVERMLAHCRRFETKEDRFVESLIFFAREIPKDPVLARYFEPDNAADAFSETALDYSLMNLLSLFGSWPKGFTRKKRRGAAEVFNRLLFSLVVVPQPEEATRAFVEAHVRPIIRMWLGESP